LSQDDDLSILDLENIILTGQVVERQRDRTTRETKHVIQGATLAGCTGEVIVKIGQGGELVVITVCLC
jgi:D-aminopeptidase